MINKVILIGNIGKAPETRRLENGATVVKFSLATNESYKDKDGNWQDKTEWHNIVLWNKQAERAEKTLKKGSRIYFEGKLTYNKWQDKDGNNRSTPEVVGTYFRTLDKIEQPVSTNGTPPANEPGDDLPF
jgi:single-strand DNA-binding protein